MIKKRTRPATVTRERELVPEPEEPEAVPENDDEAGIDISDLLELRKLKRAREGIDAAKLRQGDAKKRRIDPATAAIVTAGGLREVRDAVEDWRATRPRPGSNGLRASNALGIDRHMENSIEKNMYIRYGGTKDDDELWTGPSPTSSTST